jgi:hypothetical protein
LIAVAFPFVRVTAFCPLLVPTATAAQLRVDGDAALAPPDDPTPERETTCGLLLAESTKLRLAVRVPAAPGWKIMLALHVAERPRVPPQLVVEIRKSAALAPLTVTLLIVIDEPGPFDNVTDCAGLLVPGCVPVNERLAGEADAVAGVTPPTPDSATTCGLPEAASVKFRFAAREPDALGLNTSVAEQLPPTERLAPQVVPETTKSDAFVPVTAIPLMLSAEVLPFDSVTACDAALDPTFVLPNATVKGLAATTPLVPKPDRATVCGLLLSESMKFSVAVLVPVAVGPKRTLAVQLTPDASVAPQVLLNTVKSPGLAPVNPRLLILIVAVPAFVSVTTFCPPLLPTTTAAQLTVAGDTVAATADAATAAFAQTSAENASTTSFTGSHLRSGLRFPDSFPDRFRDELAPSSASHCPGPDKLSMHLSPRSSPGEEPDSDDI